MEIKHINKRGTIAFCCMLLVLSFLVSNSHSTTTQEEIEADRLKHNKPSKWKLLSSPPSLTLSTYWEAIKNKYLAMAPSYAKPNTEFRGEVVDKKERGAIGESIEKAKETIEDSAKSAAKMAMEAADDLKNTKSHKTDPQDEL